MINIIAENGVWEAWSDTDIGERDGRCLASGYTLMEALTDAQREIQGELDSINSKLSELSKGEVKR